MTARCRRSPLLFTPCFIDRPLPDGRPPGASHNGGVGSRGRRSAPLPTLIPARIAGSPNSASHLPGAGHIGGAGNRGRCSAPLSALVPAGIAGSPAPASRLPGAGHNGGVSSGSRCCASLLLLTHASQGRLLLPAADLDRTTTGPFAASVGALPPTSSGSVTHHRVGCSCRSRTWTGSQRGRWQWRSELCPFTLSRSRTRGGVGCCCRPSAWTGRHRWPWQQRTALCPPPPSSVRVHPWLHVLRQASSFTTLPCEYCGFRWLPDRDEYCACGFHGNNL